MKRTLTAPAAKPGGEITVAPLARHRWAIATLQQWFEAEWPDYYGPGGPGRAVDDLAAYANESTLPVGVVALQDGRVCGVAALKQDSIASHSHLSPWASAGLVDPALRGCGIGALLLGALEDQARTLGFARIHCATATSASLLRRRGWAFDERIVHEGHELDLFHKSL